MKLTPDEIQFYVDKAAHGFWSGSPIALLGPPGSGQTFIARRAWESIATNLTDRERLDIHDNYGRAQMSPPVDAQGLIMRPFRAPHHSVSSAAINATPRGELLLADRGVIYLDEVQSFRPDILDDIYNYGARSYLNNRYKIIVAGDGIPQLQPSRGFYLLFLLNATAREFIWQGLNNYNTHHLQKLHPDARSGPANMQTLIDDYLNQDYALVCTKLRWNVRNAATSSDAKIYQHILEDLLYCDPAATGPSAAPARERTEKDKWMDFMKPPPLPDDYEGGGFMGLPSWKRRRR